jgi:uncharacterized lipoprotein YddW (UPF0748 family)
LITAVLKQLRFSFASSVPVPALAGNVGNISAYSVLSQNYVERNFQSTILPPQNVICMKNLIRPLLLTLIVVFVSSAQSIPPKREFRGAWIATVENFDWPARDKAQSYQSQLTTILDNLKAIGINAVVFQIRPECDALYQSSIEPWSYWLTGTQGVAPNPLWDPLQFAITEAHKRGMELHAWFNPYRAVKTVKSGAPSYPLASNHVAVKHPEWLLKFSNEWLLDPGLPDVRAYDLSVILDVVRRYDIDGVHWDDYFYSYNGITNQDSASWRLYRGSFTNIGDWRRNNVNVLIKAVHDSIQAIKPWVKWGVSPFGIWKSGVPAGVSGLSAYDDLYCDAVTWLAHGWVDYIGPELYWPFGGGQDYGKLAPWWASVKNGRHLYVGQAPYRITDSNWGSSELPNQIRLDRTGIAEGSIYFRATYGVTNNPKGFADSLKNNFYKYPALMPAMTWKDSIPPLPPANLAGTVNANGVLLQWQNPALAADGDSARRYVVYSAVNFPAEIDMNDPRAIREITTNDTTQFQDSFASASSVQYEAIVTSLDRLWNESGTTSRVYVAPSGKPYIALNTSSIDFGNVAIGNASVDSLIVYNHSANTLTLDSAYVGGVPFRASTDNKPETVNDSAAVLVYFSPTTVGQFTDTVFLPNNSALSLAKIFVKGNSPAPMMTSTATGVGFGTIVVGQSSAKTVSLSNSSINTLQVDSIVHQSSVFTLAHVSFPSLLTKGDTLTLSMTFSPDTAKVFFDTLKIYSNAQNSPFKIILVGIGQNPDGVEKLPSLQPLVYRLDQNYPNPFNPSTHFRFSIADYGFVSLKVYNVLGQEVATVVNGQRAPGMYDVEWNASALPSGVYIYRLQSGSFVDAKKLLLEK